MTAGQGSIDNVLVNARPESAGQVAHAVALFRSRTADAEYKRSAILTLAGVLEERRQLIKAELGSADEGALFQIANKFAIRHQRAGQQADYDPAFLDWIFWWYLATVELIDRIISLAGRHERLTGRPFSRCPDSATGGAGRVRVIAGSGVVVVNAPRRGGRHRSPGSGGR